MASKFKAKQQARREELCQKLVSSFLPGLQASDPANFNLAFNFVAQNVAEPGRSIDIRDTDEWFDSLAQRCETDSQFAKAARIRALSAEVKHLGFGLKGDYSDAEYRILMLFMLLAERPLDSSLEAAAKMVREMREQRLVEDAAAAAVRTREEAELLALIRSEASSDSEDEQKCFIQGGRGAYSSPSSLSDRSEDDRPAWEGGHVGRRRGAGPIGGRGNAVAGSVVSTPAPQIQATSPRPPPLPVTQRDSGGLLQGQVTFQPWLQQPQPAPQPPTAVVPDPPPSAGRQRLPPRSLLAPGGSLRARLVAVADLPFTVAGGITPLPRVLLALLAALQGRSSEEIPWDSAKCSFLPVDDLYLAADISYGAARAAVRPLIRAATGIRRLDDWVQTCLQRHRSEGPPAADAMNSGSRGIDTVARRSPSQAAAASAPASPGPVGSVGGSEGSLQVPAWLLEAAGVKGRTVVRLVQGPTLQSLHQAVASCLHALRIPLVELEQRVTSAAAAMAAVTATGNEDLCCQQQGKELPYVRPQLPSLHELVLSCQPYIRRASGLVTAYLDIAKPLVMHLVALATPQAAAAAAAATTIVDTGVSSRLRSMVPVATVPSVAAASGGIGRSVVLQMQAGLVLERLHSMNEKGWLVGVFKALESHAHRCMLLYLYLCALEPLLDGLAEWLWNSGTGAAGAVSASGSGAGGGCISELPADFFILRGSGPGREVPPDHPAFWREGYAALMRPQQPATAGPTAPPVLGGAALGSGSSLGVIASGHNGLSYLCPPFLEPLVPIIMAAGKSLRLRQREADSLEAAATTTAGAAGPGYGSTGSAVLDPVALEESYELYGLHPENEEKLYGKAGSLGAGGRDLKRGLMEQLMSYLVTPTLGLADKCDLSVMLGTSLSSARQQTVRHAAAIGGVGDAAAVMRGAGVVAVPQAVSGGGVAAAGGLWARMATASARLEALCQGDEGGFASSYSPGRSGSDGYTSASMRASRGRITGVGGGAAGDDGPEIGDVDSLRVRAPCPDAAARVRSSPVTPLDCSGSDDSSPGDAAGYRQHQHPYQRHQTYLDAGQLMLNDLITKEGDCPKWEGCGDGGMGEKGDLGGWWPRRCELLLRLASGLEAARGSSSVGGAGIRSASQQGGPWHRIHRQLRAGPRAALNTTPGTCISSLFSALPGWGRIATANAYQHPALDLLLMHACGRVPSGGQQPAIETASASGRGGESNGHMAAAPCSSPAPAAATPLGLPHPQELLRRGLVEPLQDRAYHVNDALLLKVLSGWGLETRLMALPAVFLLSSPAVRSWADRLVSALLGGMRLGEPPLEEHQLELMLQEALTSACPDDILPPSSSLVLSLAPATGQEAAGGASGPSTAGANRAATAKASTGTGSRQEPPKFQAVQELDRSVLELERLQLGVAPSWVVALIADARVLRAYSQALVFMLQLRWVRTALDTAHKSSCLAWRERETRAHPNRWKPLRSGGCPGAARAPLQRTLSANVAEAPSGMAPGVGHNVRGSNSNNSLLSGAASTATTTRNVSSATGGPGGGGSAAVGTTGGSVGGLSPAAISAKLQAPLAAMVHFMATLEQWVATQLVHDAWVQLMTDLNASRNLDDVCDAHTAYTVTLLRRCFRYSGEEGSRHMGAALRKCLDACLRFAAAVSSLTGGGAAKVAAGILPNPLAARLQAEALHAASQFSYWLGYLVRFVSTRALLSPSSDLGDLLMRLNYNDCYSAHFMPEELVAQQLATQHCATAAARGWAALGPGPNPNTNTSTVRGPGATSAGSIAAAVPGGTAPTLGGRGTQGDVGLREP